MKRKLSIISIVASSIMAVWCADTMHYIPALVLTGYMAFWLYANTIGRKKKPRADQAQGKRTILSQPKTKVFNFYDSTVDMGMQTKTWTPAGKALTTVHFME